MECRGRRPRPHHHRKGSASETRSAYTSGPASDDERPVPRTLADLHRPLDLRATLNVVLRALVPHHVPWAAVALVDASRRSRFIAVEDEDAARASELDVRVGEPDDEPLRHGGAVATVVPLTVADAPFGHLHLGPRRSREDAAFDAVLQHCAVALANAQRFERERRVALTFQNAALVSELPAHPRYRFDAVYETGRSDELVGGDWYDAFALDDGRVVVSIGDVVGSGLHAAIAMVNVRQSIRGVAQVHPDPVLMLEAADRTLRMQHPDRYVTAFVGVLDPVTQRMTYANAGHPRPIVRHADETMVQTLGGGIPLGLAFEDERSIEEIAVPPGALVLLYTDGLTEATKDVLDGELRLERAARALSPAARGPARLLHDAVLRGPSRDDVAILAIRAEPGEQLPRWRLDPRWSDLARRVRDDVRRELRRIAFPDDRLIDVEVVLLELFGNAVRHAPGPIDVLLETRDRIALHVLDRGPGFQFNPRLPNDLYSEFGRGLFLIASLAQAFFVEHRAGGGSHSRVVFTHEPLGEPT